MDGKRAEDNQIVLDSPASRTWVILLFESFGYFLLGKAGEDSPCFPLFLVLSSLFHPLMGASFSYYYSPLLLHSVALYAKVVAYGNQTILD